MKKNERSLEKIDGELTQKSQLEINTLEQIKKHTRTILDHSGPSWNLNLLSTLSRQTLSRVLFYDEIYKLILNTPGVICEFGIHWCASMSLLSNLRGIYEPYNHSRKIIGFDTFDGFSSLDGKDDIHNKSGDYQVGLENFEAINENLENIEKLSPLSHIKKFELVKGDAVETFEKWLDNNPALIISLAILDFDIYKPTKKVLTRVTERFTKGSVIIFDELNCPHFPGETLALMETIGINNLKLKRHPHQPWCSYAIWE